MGIIQMSSAEVLPLVLLCMVITLPEIGNSQTLAPITQTVGLCDNKFMNVSLDLDFLGVVRVDSSLETVEYNLILQLSWLDKSLSWTPNNNETSNKFRLAKDICFPDLVFEGSITSTLQGISSSTFNREVTISPEGLVTVYHPFIYTGLCRMRLEQFPFDTQKCKMTVFSPTRTIEYLDLYSIDAGWVEGALTAEEWIVSSTIGTLKSVSDTVLDDRRVAVVIYEFTMSRRCGFYLLHLSLPSTLVALLATVGFFTPYASDEKRQEKNRLGMSAMLALAVQMMIVARSLPVTGDTPILTRYNVILLMLVVIGTLIAAATVSVQQQAILYKWKIGSCMRGICLSCLPAILCIKPLKKGKVEVGESQKKEEIKKDDNVMVRHRSAGTTSQQWVDNLAVPHTEKQGNEFSKEEWIYLTLVTDRFFMCLLLFLQALAVIWFCSHIQNL